MKRLGPATTLYEPLPLPLSSRLPRRAVGPERTRISCLATLDKVACAPFFKERRMLFASATNFHRKSGEAKRRDLRFYGPFMEMFFDGGH